MSLCDVKPVQPAFAANPAAFTAIWVPCDANWSAIDGSCRTALQPGNYVIAGVGNYVIENPSNLGNHVIADIQLNPAPR